MATLSTSGSPKTAQPKTAQPKTEQQDTDIDINIDMRVNLGSGDLNGKEYYSSILMKPDEWANVTSYIKEKLKILFDNDIKSMLVEYKYDYKLFKAKLSILLSKSPNNTCQLLHKLLNEESNYLTDEQFIRDLLTNALNDLVHDHHNAGRTAATHFVKCFKYEGGQLQPPFDKFKTNPDAIALSIEAYQEHTHSNTEPQHETHTDKRNKTHDCITGILPPLFDVFDTGVVGCARKFMEQVRTLKVFASICDPQGQGPDVGEYPDFDILFEIVLYNMSLLLTTSLFRTFNEHGIFLCASLPKKKSEPGKKREDWLKDPSNYVLRVMRYRKANSKLYVSDDINILVGGGGKCPFSVPGIAKDLSNTLPVYLKKSFIFEWNKMSNIWRSLLSDPDQKISLLDFIEKLEENDKLYLNIISILRDLYYANKMHGDSGQLTLALFLSELDEYFKYNEKSKSYEFVDNIMYKNKVSARSKDTWAAAIMTILKGPITIGTDDPKFQYTTTNPYAKFDGIDKFASWPLVSSNGALLVLDEDASVKKDKDDEIKRKKEEDELKKKIELEKEQEKAQEKQIIRWNTLTTKKVLNELKTTEEENFGLKKEIDELNTSFHNVQKALEEQKTTLEQQKTTTDNDRVKIKKLQDNISAAKKVIEQFSKHTPALLLRKRTHLGNYKQLNEGLLNAVSQLKNGDYDNNFLTILEKTIDDASTHAVEKDTGAEEEGAAGAAVSEAAAEAAEEEEAGAAKKPKPKPGPGPGLGGGKKNFTYEYLSDSSYDSDTSEKSHENIFYNYLMKNELKGGLVSFNEGDQYYKATSEEIESTLKSTKVHNKSIEELLKFSKFAQAQLTQASFDKFISIDEIVKRAEQLAKYDKDILSHIKSKNMVLKELEKRKKDTEQIYGLYKRDKSNKTSSMFSREREEAIKKIEEPEKTKIEMVFSEISEKHFEMDKDNTKYAPRDIFTEYQIEETEPKKFEKKIDEKLKALEGLQGLQGASTSYVDKFRKVTIPQLPTIKYNKEWNTLIELLKDQMQTIIPPSMEVDSEFAFLSSLKENITHALVNLIHSAASNVSLAQLEPIYNSVLIFMQHVSPIIHKTGRDSASKKYYYELSLCLNKQIIKFIVVDDEKADNMVDDGESEEAPQAQAQAAPAATQQIASNDNIFNPFKKFDLSINNDEIKTFFEKTKIKHLNKLFELTATTTAFFMIYSLNIIRLLYSNIEHDFINMDINDYEIMIINAKELLSSYLYNSYNYNEGEGNTVAAFDSLQELAGKLNTSDESTAFKILYFNILKKNSFSDLAQEQTKHNKTLRTFSMKISSIIKKASQLKKFLEDGLIKVEELIKSYNYISTNSIYEFEKQDNEGAFKLYIDDTIKKLQKIKIEILIEIELLIILLNKLKKKSYELVYGLLTTPSNTQASFDNCIDDLYELNNLINMSSDELSDNIILKKIEAIKQKNKLAGKVCDILYHTKYKKTKNPIANLDYVVYDVDTLNDNKEVSEFMSNYITKTYKDNQRSVKLYYGSLYNTNKIIKEWHIKNLSLYIELRNEVIKARLYDITMLETIFYAVFNVFNVFKKETKKEIAEIAKKAFNDALSDLINALSDLINAIIEDLNKKMKDIPDILYQNFLEIKKIGLKLRNLIQKEGISISEPLNSKIEIMNKMIEKFPKPSDGGVHMIVTEETKEVDGDSHMGEADGEADGEEAQLIKNIEHFLSIINIELKVLNPLKQLDIFKEACKIYDKNLTEKEKNELYKANQNKGDKILQDKVKKLKEKEKKINAARKKIDRFKKFEIFKDDIDEYPNKNDLFRIFMKEKMEYLNILFEILCNNKNISSLIKSLKKEDDITDLGIYLDFGSENILDKDSGTFVDNSD